jgi:hypothetical protein
MAPRTALLGCPPDVAAGHANRSSTDRPRPAVLPVTAPQSTEPSRRHVRRVSRGPRPRPLDQTRAVQARVRRWSCTAAPTSRTEHGGMGYRTRSTLCCRTGEYVEHCGAHTSGRQLGRHGIEKGPSDATALGLRGDGQQSDVGRVRRIVRVPTARREGDSEADGRSARIPRQNPRRCSGLQLAPGPGKDRFRNVGRLDPVTGGGRGAPKFDAGVDVVRPSSG